MNTKGGKSLHDCSGPLLVYHRTQECQKVVWPVWQAIEESDVQDRLKFYLDQGGPGWLRKVTVYSRGAIGDFGEEVLQVCQQDCQQFPYNVKIWEDSVVGVEACRPQGFTDQGYSLEQGHWVERSNPKWDWMNLGMVGLYQGV